jgi:septum formation protein
LFLEGDSGGDVSPRPPLVLASASPYRRELLARLGLPFETEAPGVEEAPAPGELPMDRALRLALEKARAVAARRTDALVIGSDQVAFAQDRVLEKPGDATRARAQLTLLSGGTARFYTACAVLAVETGLRVAHLDTTLVTFRTLKPEEIERYVARDEPYDCAGSFKAEGFGISLLESIDSRDPSALIGLPLIWLAGALRSAGYPLP